MKTHSSNGEVFHSLTFEEKIRMNRLIQGGIDLEGFRVWYGELKSEERFALAHYLINVFLCEQHCSGGNEVVQRALRLAEKDLSDPMVQAILSAAGGYDPQSGFKEFPSMDQTRFLAWLRSSPEDVRMSAFEFCALLFGIHEGTRIDACAGKCSHWWHQNLRDPAVLKKLLEGR